MSDPLDYDQLIWLDAENLAEAGILEAYESLLPELRKYVPQPAEIEELIDNDVGRYAVRSGTREFIIYAPDLDDEGGESWGRATVTFFTIVNDQLANSHYRFYAIAGGNAQAINYFVAQKYVEAVSEFARSPNAKTILFPVEATQLIGTLGGIGELAKEIVGETKEKASPKPKAQTTAGRGAPPGVPGVPRIEG